MSSLALMDWLGMGDLADWIESAIQFLGVVIYFGCWGAIFQKAGYPRWYSISAVIPPAPFIWLALATWPLERRCMYAAEAGWIYHEELKGVSDEDKAYAMLDKAGVLVRELKYEQALTIYSAAAKRFAGTEAGNDAKIELESLREKMRAEGVDN